MFHTIFKVVFPFLYDERTMSCVRLALTGEDPSEYRTFEKFIRTENTYSEATIMLCIFHTIFSTFKEKIRTRLPHQNGNKLLSDKGKFYGM